MSFLWLYICFVVWWECTRYIGEVARLELLPTPCKLLCAPPRCLCHARRTQAFAAGGAANQRLLAKAFMPASRKALGVPLLGGTAGRTAALSVMPFVAQLLQQQQHEQQAQPSGGSAGARKPVPGA